MTDCNRGEGCNAFASDAVERSEKGVETVKQHLVIFATLAALAVPGLSGAEEKSAPATELTGRVDASELADLLVQKRLITPEEEKTLMHPVAAPSLEERTMQDYFDVLPYQREGGRGAP